MNKREKKVLTPAEEERVWEGCEKFTKIFYIKGNITKIEITRGEVRQKVKDKWNVQAYSYSWNDFILMCSSTAT